jgi:cation transport protein ChaC
MTTGRDPFHHHPELRAEISDPLESFFRSFSTDRLVEKTQELGMPVWWYSDEDREALRAAALRDRPAGDLWVFAYGSLMWDPAIRFAEVRRAHVRDYARRFILKDIYGARGTAEAPGLMAALDAGGGCDGLAFRIARERVDEETEVLWRREQVGPAYRAVFVDASIAGHEVKALAFVADHDAELIDATLTREEQIRFLATGTGFAGSSMDYLRNVQEKLAALGIDDADVDDLLRDARSYLTAP